MSARSPLAHVEQVPHGRTARRLEWQHLPPGLRGLVERHLGSPVVEAQSQGAGYTPGLAARLIGADGSTLFVKAANRRAQRRFADAYAAEAAVVRALPPGLPMPALRWSLEDDLWVVLAFDCLEGDNPRRPWQQAQLDACLDALEVVAERLDPVPSGLRLAPATEELPGLLTGWEHVRRTRPGWPHLEDAAALARGFLDVPDRTHFVHFDARDDNFVIDPKGRAWLCDWNWPALGPPWTDTVHLLVSAFGDGLDADALLRSRPLTRSVPDDHVDTVIAGMCGFMLEARDRPAPPSSPYLRVHSNWYAEAAWGWLAQRRGWSI
jgi:aminoglycoside phosphotransferase (APT) family kinase protein